MKKLLVILLISLSYLCKGQTNYTANTFYAKDSLRVQSRWLNSVDFNYWDGKVDTSYTLDDSTVHFIAGSKSWNITVKGRAVSAVDLSNYYNKSQSDARYLQSYTETDPVYLANGVPQTRTLSGGYGINTIGNLTQNRTISVDSASLSLYYLRRKDSTIYYPYANNPKGYLTSFSESQDLQDVTTNGNTTTEDINVSNGGDGISLRDEATLRGLFDNGADEIAAYNKSTSDYSFAGGKIKYIASADHVQILADGGLLIPRLTTTQRDAISSPATGLMIYNTTTNAFNFYNGGWQVIASGAPTLQGVTDGGNTTTNNVLVNELGLYDTPNDAYSLISYEDGFGFKFKQTNNANKAIFNFDALLTDEIYAFPRASGIIPVSVNGNTANALGNITIAVGTGDLLSSNNLSDLNNAATARANLGSTIGTNVQAYDADLTTYASITPSANVQTLLGSADYAAMKTLLSLNNADNTSDATKNSAANALTNKTGYNGLIVTANTGVVTTGTWNAGAIGVIYGGNGLTTATLGDIRYGSGTNTLAALAGNITTTKKFLTQTGNGTVSAAPAWGTIAAGDITGLTNSNLSGSAGITDANLASSYVYANGTRALTGNWNAGAFNIASTQTGATAATIYDGFVLSNTTAASSGNQMYSPAIHLTGQGWKTTATAASQSVDARMYVVPVQGAANPSANLIIDASINGGAYTTGFAFSSAGNLGIGSTSPSATGLEIIKSGGTTSGIRIGNSNIAAQVVVGSTLQIRTESAAKAIEFDQNTEVARFAASTGNLLLKTTTDVASSILTMNSTSQGVLIPRMTKTQRDAISTPATGLAIYQTDNTPGLRVYNGTNWMRYTETAD